MYEYREMGEWVRVDDFTACASSKCKISRQLLQSDARCDSTEMRDHDGSFVGDVCPDRRRCRRRRRRRRRSHHHAQITPSRHQQQSSRTNGAGGSKSMTLRRGEDRRTSDVVSPNTRLVHHFTKINYLLSHRIRGDL